MPRILTPALLNSFIECFKITCHDCFNCTWEGISFCCSLFLDLIPQLLTASVHDVDVLIALTQAQKKIRYLLLCLNTQISPKMNLWAHR